MDRREMIGLVLAPLAVGLSTSDSHPGRIHRLRRLESVEIVGTIGPGIPVKPGNIVTFSNEPNQRYMVID